jgi:hypothetical protein
MRIVALDQIYKKYSLQSSIKINAFLCLDHERLVLPSHALRPAFPLTPILDPLLPVSALSPYSALMFARRIDSPHRAISLTMWS